MPTRFRNLSATAMIWNGEIFLFDCGEGAQIQLQKAGLRPGRLQHIFISHFHGDHFYGLPGLLTSLQMAECTQDVHLYGPEGLKSYIDFLSKISRFTLHYPLHFHEVSNDSQGEEWRYKDFKIICRPLRHRIRTLGWAFVENTRPGKFDADKAKELDIPVGPIRSRLQRNESIELADGRIISPESVLDSARPGHRFAYCLDTRPCAASVELAKNADLLVHEATFGSQDADSAKLSGHSTAKQAAQIAKEAGAERLGLTHISSRYQINEIEGLEEESCKIFPRSFLARDLLRMKIEYKE